ncbi:MAG TPA: hypothetical protein VGQ81_00385 [Acidobacteriota bacterium]|jgi:hypothetical protein|nr:hypothetical protein [Acidobacteriota bacterium]
MQSYHVTFYLEFAAESDEDATARAAGIVRGICEREKVDEAVIVAVGATQEIGRLANYET